MNQENRTFFNIAFRKFVNSLQAEVVRVFDDEVEQTKAKAHIIKLQADSAAHAHFEFSARVTTRGKVSCRLRLNGTSLSGSAEAKRGPGGWPNYHFAALYQECFENLKAQITYRYGHVLAAEPDAFFKKEKTDA